MLHAKSISTRLNMLRLWKHYLPSLASHAKSVNTYNIFLLKWTIISTWFSEDKEVVIVHGTSTQNASVHYKPIFHVEEVAMLPCGTSSLSPKENTHHFHTSRLTILHELKKTGNGFAKKKEMFSCTVGARSKSLGLSLIGTQSPTQTITKSGSSNPSVTH
jgi:hypothetical protein